MSGAVKTGLIAAGLFAVAALAWMIFLPKLVEDRLHALTGFDIHVTVLTANPFTGRVMVRGLIARNPPEFPEKEFVEVRELETRVNVFSWIFQDRVVIDELDLFADTIEVVRAKDGKSNAGVFMAAFSRPSAAAQGAPPPATKPKQYLIHKLHIRLKRLVIADCTSSKPDVKTYNLNIDQLYNEVSQPRQLLVPQVVRSLYSFGLRHDLAQLLPGEFGTALADAVAGITHVIAPIATKPLDYIKGLFEKLEQSSKP